MVLAIPYFVWMDRRMNQPDDIYAALGTWMVGKGPRPDGGSTAPAGAWLAGQKFFHAADVHFHLP